MDKEDINTEEMDGLEEETETAASLKPNSKSVSDPMSKMEAINSVVGAMGSMDKTTLVKWFNDAMALIGKEASNISDGSASKNASTVDMSASKAVATTGPKTKDAMPKLAASIKEDVTDMFDGQELSEEFKEKASTLMEAAITAQVLIATESVRQQLEEEYTEKLQEHTSIIETKLDQYLDYVVEQWMKENKVAIESTLRSEIMEELIGGLKNLFVEHYIDIPEQKVDLVQEMTQKNAILEDKLNSLIEENNELKTAVSQAKIQEALSEMATDLTLTQQEKFSALAEGITFDGDMETYKRKLGYIKETYFPLTTPSSVTGKTNIDEETFDGETTQKVVSTANPEILHYASALARNAKK